MLIGYADETLRDEVPRNAASTPPVKAVLAAGYGHDVGKFYGSMICTPRLGLQRGFVVVLSGRCSITGNLIPSLLR
jgi:hypothetical protein